MPLSYQETKLQNSKLPTIFGAKLFLQIEFVHSDLVTSRVIHTDYPALFVPETFPCLEVAAPEYPSLTPNILRGCTQPK